MDVEAGLRAQIRNIEARYGRPLPEWFGLIAASGLGVPVSGAPAVTASVIGCRCTPHGGLMRGTATHNDPPGGSKDPG